MGAVSSEDDYCTAVAVAISHRLLLPCISNVKDADGSDKIELRTADIDVRPILDEAKHKVCRIGVHSGFWRAPSGIC